MTRFVVPLAEIVAVIALALVALAILPNAGAPVPDLRLPAPTAPTTTPSAIDEAGVVGSGPIATRSGSRISAPPSTSRPTSSQDLRVVGNPAVGTVFLAGFATWYDDGPGFYAAAGPDVRRALGDWRGTTVVVCAVTGGSRCEATPVTDWCLCGQRQGDPTLLDLSVSLFTRICGALSAGLCRVTVQP